ncbi:CotH kinase family protein [Arthrobacter sp. AK01]|uniref:CotH kinase family protein n=1 Tax=Micrococcaceae TaxID=1268 RepID=UPI001E291AC5|nr:MULTISPECIES: CotH kinase family protein [Micrococcaceae]MCD4853339.1 CotH kinase family protein [Arthrobacter sp. AK01]MCP1411483.1 spore coat protein CotH [Paenarthrobacter sp. A20]
MHRTPRTVIAVSVLAVTLAVAGCGAGAGTQAAGTSVSTGTAASTTAATTLFDAGSPHTVSIQWDEAAYAKMIAAYEADGSKEWIKADITIDGTMISAVGVRLKGNSTLRSLSGNGSGPGGNATSSGISSDVPESLPLLIDFGKYVDNQTYQGLTQLSLRPGSPVLNEALALAMTQASGQATQRYAYTTYSVNGGPTQTRLLVENPGETYADALFDTPGVLFKADAESSFTYQGDDLATYEEQFKQLNAKETADFQPVVAFLKWLSEASDEEFDAGLAERVDVESFARYAATMNLLVNGDDMAGPGQNYYLWYNLDTKKISIISWDLNLALAGDATATPDQEVSIGGGGEGAGGGMQPPSGFTPPSGLTPPSGDPAGSDAFPGMGGAAGGGRGGNELKERFLASADFKTLYDDAYKDLYQQLYASGKAAGLLDQIAASVPTSDNLSASDVAKQTDTLKAFITERTEALKDKV